MKRSYVLFLTLLLNLPGLYAQYSVGPGGDAANLWEAFKAINESGMDNGDVVLVITGDIEEPFPAVLKASGYDGSSFYSSITIYPQSDGITISGNFNGPLIDLDGADNIRFDGRVNQAGAVSLTLTNINSGTSASTIRMAGSSTGNSVEYCYVRGAGTGAGTGTIFIAGASDGTGNDDNMIANNKITRDPAGRPVNAVYSSGTAGYENSGNTISNNEFYDIFNAGLASCGINIESHSEGFTITGNSFYETTSFAPSAGVGYNAIRVNNSSGTGFTVTGNFIGGKEANCGGTSWTKTGGNNNAFTGISINAGTSASSGVHNNTIKKFAWSNSGNASWTGISIQSGNVLLGTTAGNFIGDATAAGSVTVTGGAAGTVVSGISIAGAGTISCRNNTVANISNATTFSGAVLTGIYLNGSALANTAGENFIHHLTSASSSAEIYGIRVNNGGYTISNNIISLGGNTASTLYGIYETGIAGNNNSLYFNTVYLSGNPSAGTAASYGVYSASAANNRDFRNNILSNTRSNVGTASGSHYALYIVISGGTITCDYNNYHVPGTGGIFGYYGTDGNQPVLPIVTGQDTHSSVTDPLFATAGGASASDYVPAAFLPAVTGTSVLTDYNGSTRDGATPTMGAFETAGCADPSGAGTISLAVTAGCTPFNPLAITGTAPTGYSGALEYKWQQSVTGSGAGFTDISSSNSTSYDPGPLTQTTWFKRLVRVTCSADWSGAAESNVLELTVNPLPSASITGDPDACLQTTLTAVTDAVTPVYTWYKDLVIIPGETASTLNVITPGSYKVKIRNPITLCEQTSAASAVTINPQPTAVVSGALTGCGFTILTVTTDATDPSYSWYRDNVEITGETASTLNVTASGLYKVKVKNGVTLCERTSTNKTVTINPLPAASITGILTACETTTLTAVSDAGSRSYKWYKDDVEIAGETAQTLVVTSSGSYKVKVKNDGTSCEQTSSASAVTINTLPVVVITGTLTSCGPTILSAVTDASSPSYTWYRDNTEITGQVSGSLTVTASGEYKVKVISGTTSCERTSAPSAVVINPLPSATLTLSRPGNICAGTGTIITIALSETGISYQLRNSSGNIGSPVTGTGGTIELPTGITGATTTFNVLATNSVTSCSAVLNSQVTVTADPVSAGGTLTGVNSSIIYGESTGTLTLSGQTGAVIKWQKMPASGSWTDITNTGLTYSETPVAGEWQYRVQVKSGVCSEAFSAPFTVSVAPRPLVITANNQVKTYGTLFSFSGNEYTSQGLTGSDAITGVIIASTGAPADAGVAGSPYAITVSEATGTGLDNYTVSYVNGNLTLNKSILTVTADNKTKEHFTANPPLTYTITGFLNSETQSVLDVLPSVSTTATTGSAAGTYPITCSGGSDDNYSYIYMSGTLTVTRTQQVITFSDYPEKLLVSDSYTLGAVSTSGLEVLFESLDPEKATVSGDQLRGVSAGSARVRAYHPGNDSFVAAESIVTVNVYSTHKDIMHLFTPNGDGFNDYWELTEISAWGKCNVKVYNRWGKLVYASKDYDNRWNGTSDGSPLPEGPYVFIIETENAGVVKGMVNIVR